MSQGDFARAVREAGARAARPDDADKRLVQRWEAGGTTAPRPVCARALEAVTALPAEFLGFAPRPSARSPRTGTAGTTSKRRRTASHPWPPGRSPSRRPRTGTTPGCGRPAMSTSPAAATPRTPGSTTSSCSSTATGSRSAARPAPPTARSPWTARSTATSPPVRGRSRPRPRATTAGPATTVRSSCSSSRPAGRRMTGKWVGFGKEFDVNTGPWELVFQDASTTKATLEAYNRRPDARSRAHDGAPLTGRGGRARERVVFMGTGGAGGHAPWAAESGARWVQGRGAPSRRQTRASRSPGGGVGGRTRRCGSGPSVLFGGEVIGGAGRAGWSPEGEDWRYG